MSRASPSRSQWPWFFARLTETLKVTPELMGGDVDWRDAQARRLMPAGVSDQCVANRAGLAKRTIEN